MLKAKNFETFSTIIAPDTLYLCRHCAVQPAFKSTLLLGMRCYRICCQSFDCGSKSKKCTLHVIIPPRARPSHFKIRWDHAVRKGNGIHISKVMTIFECLEFSALASCRETDGLCLEFRIKISRNTSHYFFSRFS